MQIGNAKVDHEAGRRLQIGRVTLEQTPDGHAFLASGAAPFENGTSPIRHIQSKVSSVPGTKGLGVIRFEENSTYPRYALHLFSSWPIGLRCGPALESSRAAKRLRLERIVRPQIAH